MANRHRCPTCRGMHLAPKASNALRTIVLSAAFIVVEVLAAIQLGGWLAAALWGIAAWNAAVLAFVITGLAMLAADSQKAHP